MHFQVITCIKLFNFFTLINYFSRQCLIFVLFLSFYSCNKKILKLTSAAPTDSAAVMVQKTLFQKSTFNPVFNIGDTVPIWRRIHAANVSILAPSQTSNNKWKLFMRGSGDNAAGYHDNIGTLEQSATGFNPVCQWNEQTGNPNLTHGAAGAYDSRHVLDAAAVAGRDKQVVLYYMSRDDANSAGLCGAISADGGLTFKKFYNNPIKKDVGPNDAVYYNDKYYLFYGDGKWNGTSFDEPLQIWLSVSADANAVEKTPKRALQVGGNGSFDSYSVNGAKIFTVSGDNRWFMLYQCSTKNFDYPERFHCAYSFDLIHWTKVKNDTPLLTRGRAGEFDHGAIWTGSVIENKKSLYIYYEGWGSFNKDDTIRDNAYYRGGNSRVGIASCSVKNFLDWVND